MARRGRGGVLDQRAQQLGQIVGRHGNMEVIGDVRLEDQPFAQLRTLDDGDDVLDEGFDVGGETSTGLARRRGPGAGQFGLQGRAHDRMVRAFEEAGAGAVHLEDQLLPKKCGHLNDKKLADAHDMAAKVAAAAKARRDLYVIARTDAAASEGLDGAVARARLYMEAGADAIFPEALTSVEMFKEVRAALPGVKLLANMTEFGRTPALTAQEFEDLGYDMVIWPVSSLRVANKAQEKLYATLVRDGATTAMLPEMQTRSELYATIGLGDFEALDASIAASIAPDWKV